jgi:hypothetical protein
MFHKPIPIPPQARQWCLVCERVLPENRTWPGGSNADSVAPLSAAIVASLQGDGIFNKLTPERMLKPACMICGMGLSDAVSMARWVGPECAATTSIRVFWMPRVADGEEA